MKVWRKWTKVGELSGVVFRRWRLCLFGDLSFQSGLGRVKSRVG